MKQGWEYKKLGEVCTIERGGSPRPITDYITDSEDGINWIKIGDAQEGSKYITSTKEKIRPEGLKKSRFVHKGDFILSNSMSFGRPYILKVDGCIHDGWLVIHDDKEVFIKDYLYYILSSPIMYAKFSQLAVGGVVNNLNSSLVRKVTIPLPPKSTQLSIVSELDKINELIRLKKEQLKDYDNLAQSIFYEMFGDPVENEKGWEVKKWKDVFNTILGKMLDKSKQINHLTQYKYLANKNVQWGYFDLKELRSMTFTDEELAKYELRNNDLLICEGGDAGRCAIWKETDETILFQKAIHRARLIDTNNADVVYIRYWMQFYKVNKGLKDYISKSTIEHLTGDKLKRLPIPLPPLPLQHLFAQRIEQIERQKSAVQKSITDLETLLASRMQYWFE